ncbi:MAG: SRPBCC family protein [Thalassovita sp.]
MNFSSKEDIESSIDSVFAAVTDFDSFERAALRRGAEVQRVDDLPEPGVGMRWEVGFTLRGKERELVLDMTEYDAPQKLVLTGVSQGLEGTMAIELVAMSRTRTRMTSDITLSATTLSARLLLQSMKLGRATLNKRFHLRMAEIATEVEERARHIG